MLTRAARAGGTPARSRLSVKPAGTMSPDGSTPGRAAISRVSQLGWAASLASFHAARTDAMFVWLGEVWRMASITISHVDDGTWTRLRNRGAGNRRSVGEVARLYGL